MNGDFWLVNLPEGIVAGSATSYKGIYTCGFPHSLLRQLLMVKLLFTKVTTMVDVMAVVEPEAEPALAAPADMLHRVADREECDGNHLPQPAQLRVP